MHDVLLGRVDVRPAINPTDEGPDLLPATIDLAGTEAHLLTWTGRGGTGPHGAGGGVWRLRRHPHRLFAVAPTVNALTAADDVLIPMQCETLSHRGASVARHGPRRAAAVQP